MKNKAFLAVFLWIIFSFVSVSTVSAQESAIRPSELDPAVVVKIAKPLNLIRSQMAQTGDVATVVLVMENQTNLIQEAVIWLEWHPVNANGQYGEPVMVSRAADVAHVRPGGEETLVETIPLPTVLSGEMAAFVSMESVTGELYAKSYVGKLALTGSVTATISNCEMNNEAVTSGAVVTIPAESLPVMSCTVRNTGNSEGRFTGETSFMQYGKEVGVARANAVTLRAGASDTLNFSLGKNDAMKAGEFEGVLTILDASAKSAALPLPFTLVIGEQKAQILSLATDKREYAAGEEAKVLAHMMMPFKGKTGLQVTAELGTKDGLCGRATAAYASSQMQLTVPISRECKEYSVKATLVDEAGYPLAERTIGQLDPGAPSVTLTPEKGNFMQDWWKILILAIVLIPILLFGWHVIKKRRMERMYMLFLPLVFAGVLFAHSANAGTGYWEVDMDYVSPSCPVPVSPIDLFLITGTMTTDKNSYAPGENVQLTVNFNSEDQPNDTFTYTIPGSGFSGGTLNANGSIVHNFPAPASAGVYNGVGTIFYAPPLDPPIVGGPGWVSSGCPTWWTAGNSSGTSQPLFTVVAGSPPCWKLTRTQTFSAASCTWPEPAPTGPPMPACTMGNQGQVEYRCVDDLPGTDLRLEMTCSTCVGTVPTVTLTPQTASGPSLWKKFVALVSQTKEVFAGGSVTITVGSNASLSWTSTNAGFCELSGSYPTAFDPDPNPKTVGTSGSQSLVGLPVGTHNFTIVCTGAGGSAIDNATVVVNPPPGPPVISSFINNGPIPWNTSATLSWVTGNSTTCSIDNGIGPVVPVAAGSTITPNLTTTTTYTLSCTNVNGTATAQTTVSVLPGPDYRICPSSTLVAQGATTALRSYYSASGPVDCGNTGGSVDVTNSVTWSSTSPGVASVGNGGSSGVVTGVSSGSTTISTTPYLGISAPGVTITVPCVPSNSCASAGPSTTASSLCPSETFTIDDGCGVPITCSGTRTCDFNWKEVAP